MCETQKVLIHLWQDQELGVAPFRVKTFICLPSKEMAEQNPLVYQEQMAEVCQQARALGVGLGSCNSCGMALTVNVVIEDTNGKRFVVGQDCAKKTFDAKLITDIENIERNRQKLIREARREAERLERQRAFTAERQAQRDKNGGLTDYELGQKQRAEELELLRAKFSRVNAWILTVLDRESQSDFIRSIIGKLEQRKASELSPNVLTILKDIWSRKFGRRGSKKYTEAESKFERHLAE